MSAPLFDESAAPPLPFAPALFGRGVAVIDFNADQAPDFLIATASGAVAYVNHGSAGFADETASRLPAAAQGNVVSAHLPVVGDLNGDGRDDVVLLVDGGLGADLVFFGTPAGVLSFAGTLPPVDAVSSGAALVDVDADGDLDVVRSVGSSGHVNASGRDSLALNNGAGAFVESTAFRDAEWNGDAIPTTGVTTLDANGDGRVDLFFTRADSGGATGSPGAWNVLLLGQGNGTFVDLSADLPGLKDQSFGAVPLDLEGDGDMDLVVCNSVLALSGAASGDVLVNQGGAQSGVEGQFVDRFGSIDEAPVIAESIRLGLLAADVDGNGRVDVLMRVHDLPPGGEQPLFLGRGLDFVRATNFDTGTLIAAGGAFADIDGDGDPDLLLTSSGSAGGGSPLGVARLFLNVSP